jgi:hypothetical protein
MKVYQVKHQQTFFIETAFNEARFMDAYYRLFDELLRIRNISHKRIYIAINLSNFSVSSKAFHTEPLLRKRILPAFRFLVCRN